eukprot:3027602-Pyramimonas_sp.AAC.1
MGVGVVALMSTLLRILGYNPMFATGDRLLEILEETRNFDILLLAGTRGGTPLRGAQALRGRRGGRLAFEAPHQATAPLSTPH